jgi:hypothetical protein
MEYKMENKSSQKDAILEANNLTYKFDDILNVSVNRTLKKQYFDTRTYTQPGSGQAVSTWNSGVDLIDVINSYLKWDFTITGGDRAFSFGSGSAMNLIKEVKILSSSGIELARTQDANIFSKFRTESRRSDQWIDSVGGLMGFNQDADAMDVDSPVTFLIPLCELDPFFELYDQKLLPANIASGLRVEITWEDLNTAVIHDGSGTTNATGYTITNIEFRTESVTLADSAMAVLNREAATNGLEVTMDRVYTTSKNTGTALDDNIEVRKAVSLCKGVFGVTLPTANRSAQSLDSFVSNAYSFDSADVRLGNQYYPFQPIENPREAYFHYLKQYNKLKRPANETSVNYGKFSTGGSAQIVANFETDDSLNLTGLPINSSRIIELRFSRNVATEVKTYVFMIYTSLCRASLSNTSVKI